MKTSLPSLLMIFSLTLTIHIKLSAQTWIPVTNTDFPYAFNDSYFIDQFTGYMVGYQTIRKTIDGGLTWADQWNGNPYTFNSVHFPTYSIGYVIGNNGVILKTVDGGLNWTTLASGISSSLLSIYFTSANEGYITHGFGIMKTIDGGNNFTSLNLGILINSIIFIDQNTGFASGNETIFKTTNSGVSWFIVYNMPTYQTESYFINSSIGYVVGSIGNIVKTVNGGNTWANLVSGTTKTLKSVSFANANIGCAVGYDGTIIRTTNAGVTWDSVYSGTDKHLNSINYLNSTTCFIFGNHGHILKSVDAGLTWTTIANGYKLNDGFFVGNTGYAVGSNGTIRKTINNGTDWVFLNSGTTKHLNSVFFINSNKGFVVGDQSTLLKTVDGGANWVQCINSNPNLNLYDIIFLNNDTGFAGGSGTGYKTSDGGISWTTINLVNIVSYSFLNQNIGFALSGNSANSALYKTNNGGSSWTWNAIPNSGGKLFFTNVDTGYISSPGRKTVDGGLTWSSLSANGTDIWFISSNIGYITGNGFVSKTTDAGLTWTLKPTPGGVSIFFKNTYNGFVVGENSRIYKSFMPELIPNHVDCYGNNTGSINLNVHGGSPPYTYSWSNGSNAPNLNGLFAGNYSVTITDNNGITTTGNIEIVEPQLLTAVTTSASNVNCSGNCNGNATINPSGGTLPYNYQWDNLAGNQTTATATALCPAKYSVMVTDTQGCTVGKTISVAPLSIVDPQLFLTNLAAVDMINVSPSFSAYYAYNLPNTINPPASNPRNFVDPGKHARFKVESRNMKSNGQSVVSGICKVRSNSPYIQVTDTTSALNNIGWNDFAWSADEFEIYIEPNTPPGSNAYIDFVIQENGQDYTTSCIAIPITPLKYSPTTPATIDDDNNPDSHGNDNDICEPGEIIEFYPWLDNVSTLNAEYVRGRFENLDNHSFINIWNGVSGVGTTVYDATWWNYAFAQPQTINSNSFNTTPEYDFVFNYSAGSVINDFKLYLVMAGGFKLFSGNVLSLVQWTLPYNFNSTITSINEELIKNELLIYPNPSNGNFNIIYLLPHTSTGSASEEGKLEIIDITGKVIYEMRLHQLSTLQQLSLPNYISNGIYNCVITAGNHSTSKKIAIIKD